MAPIPGPPKLQMAPTAGTAVETATPVMPVREQRAAIEKVTVVSFLLDLGKAPGSGAQLEGRRRHRANQDGIF